MEGNIGKEIVDLYKARDISKPYFKGIPEHIVHPLMPRREVCVFSSEESVSGLRKIRGFDFTTTLAASPHVDNTIPTEDFKIALQKVYGEGVNLSLINSLNTELMPAHLITWWQDAGNSCIPLNELFKLDETDRQLVITEISDQVSKGLLVFDCLAIQASVGGTWGNATKAEQKASGLSRGGSTNPIGHLHIVNYESTYSNSGIRQDIKLHDKLNLFRPLDQYLHTALSDIVKNLIIYTACQNGQSIEIKTESVHEHEDGHSFFDGYNISFRDSAELTDVFKLLSTVGGKTNQIYDGIRKVYEMFWAGNIPEEDLPNLLRICFPKDFGLYDSDILGIQYLIQAFLPTKIQLKAWGQTDRALRYERLKEKLDLTKKHDNSVTARYIYDLLIDERDIDNVVFTMPEHMSFGYLVDFDSNTKKPMRLRLFPVYATKSTIVERNNGSLIRRAGS